MNQNIDFYSNLKYKITLNQGEKLKNNQYNPLKNKILEKFRKSRKNYLDYLIGMRVFKQGVLSLFCKFIIRLIDQGIEHRPDLWRKLVKQYKFNSAKEKKVGVEQDCDTGILSDIQLIERNLTSCLNFCVRVDDKKINKLQNALKSNNFEVKDFETYYQMNSRINQIPVEDPELKGNDKLFAEKKMTRRIIRLKSRNPVIEHYKQTLKHQSKDALMTQETLWAKSGDLFSSNPTFKEKATHQNSKQLLIKKKNKYRTRSYQSFASRHEQKTNSLPTIMVNKMSESVESEIIKIYPKIIKGESNLAEESIIQYSYSQNVEDKQKINIFKPRKIWFGKKRQCAPKSKHYDISLFSSSCSSLKTKSFYDFIGKSKEELDQEKAGRLKEFKKRKFDIGSALVASMRQRIKSNAKQVVGTHGEQN